MEHDIRKDVWPFLLGHYKFGMSKKEMEQVRGAGARGAGAGSLAKGPEGGASEGSAPSQREGNVAEEG